MSDNTKEKHTHPMLSNIASIVIAGAIMLVVNTLYNLLLAHIWPVTIHFGEFSFNNFVFILVSIVSSLLLTLIILSLEIFYIMNSLGRGLLYLATPKNKRKQRTYHWYERMYTFILNSFLFVALNIVNGLVWLTVYKQRNKTAQLTPTEETQNVLTKFPQFEFNLKPDQKQESISSPSKKKTQQP